MSRKLRHIPAGGSLVEVTCRTIQGGLLMRPFPLLNDIILGVLGRAQRLYPLEIVGYSFLSNHFHLLAWTERADRLSDFMRYFSGNLAREIARLTGWKDRIWADRFDGILVTAEEEVQVRRLAYILSNCVKEDLVAKVEEWPGVHCGHPLITGEPMVEGTWFDRRMEYNARLRGKEPGPREFIRPEQVVLSQLPCWKHLTPEEYRSRIAELVREIEETAATARQESLIKPLGIDGIRAQDPETRPKKLKKSPAPFVHAATKAARKAMWEAYSTFVAAFREAAEKLKAGDRNVVFPIGSFPPRLPFVAA
jgi:REP element-mobilizing transposase RayT